MEKMLDNPIAKSFRAALYFGGAAIVAVKTSNSVKIEYALLIVLAVFLFAVGVAASVMVFKPELG